MSRDSVGQPPIIVLHLIETAGPGGAERMMAHLAARLGPGYRSEAALLRYGWLAGTLKEQGIPVTILGSTCHGFGALHSLLKVIREKRVAMLHTHEFFMNALGCVVSRLTGVPQVATVHGKNYYTDRLRRRATYRLVGKFTGQMVAVSEDVRRFVAERVGIPIHRIRVVPNGVPVDEEPSQEKVLALRAGLGLDPRTRVIGTVGSLYSIKGHRYLIDAAALVLRQLPRTEFVIVGRGGLREELQAQAERLGVARCLHFLGHRDDVRDLLEIFDVFVLPSLSEGMPLALLEAMAAGLPCVATAVGGVTEVVQNARSGHLVPAADSQALANGIITILTNRAFAEELGKSAREVVATRFSSARMVQSYREIYAELIGKPQCCGVEG